MDLSNRHLCIKINEEYGFIESINKEGKEFILQSDNHTPIFNIRLRNEFGAITEILPENLKFDSAKIENTKDDSLAVIKYIGNSELNIDINVHIRMPVDKPFSYWKLSVENNTSLYIDWIDFPGIVVPNNLKGNSGDFSILWPAMEGVEINDITLREKHMVKYGPVEYPNKGWEGYYPGPCPVQVMAYYDNTDGLYFAAHDDNFNVKGIEVYEKHNGIKLEYKLFPGGVKGNYIMDYEMVIGTFEGGWHDAAEIYRTWREEISSNDLIKLSKNKDKFPEWMKDSPITAIYPVRGQMHMGDMSLNNDYFPFTNAVEHINRLSEEFNSRVMALPMQWEGTAPWAPPHVWPPLGGEENFKEFVDKLHENNNLSGIYCSGIGWTNKSILNPEYNKEEQTLNENLIDVMCDSPEGNSPRSVICQEPIRVGYDMCPSTDFAHKVATDEVSKIITSNCDYIQFFDQNIGGASYFCYSKKHGHPCAPGRWQIDAMRKLIEEVIDVAQSGNKNVLIGCEAAAAEPFMDQLLFNDLRFEVNYFVGNPVPLYNYIYHEYVNNFMGNQNMVGSAMDLLSSPMNVLQRIAYSFAAGDMLSVVLTEGGQIHWDWCTKWDIEKPDQKSIMLLIKNLNAWRKGPFMKFLRYGRMQKPYEISGTYNIPMVLFTGEHLNIPSLITSRWLDQDGRNAQLIVNYTDKTQNFSIKYPEEKAKKHIIHTDFMSDNRQIVSSSKTIENEIEPFSAIFVEFV